MRIIGGKYRGRVLHPPKGLPVRPTTDKTKEAMFNILHNYLVWEETRVLDLFAGTGNISLECWSRGAAEVVSVDRHPKCIEAIRRAALSLGIEHPTLLKRNILSFVKRTPESFDLIFMDPPYALPEQEGIAETVLSKGWLSAGGWLVAEHSVHRDYSHLPGHQFSRTYGSSVLSFFHREKEEG